MAITTKARTPAKPLSQRPIGRQVALSNALIRSASSVTTAEKRVLYLAISKFGKGDTIAMANGTPEIILTVADYQSLSGGSASQARKDLRLASLRLFDRTILWTVADTTIKAHRTRWTISMADYTNGSIMLKINPDLHMHLLEFAGQFTVLKLAEIKKLSGKYAWRLYEILKSYEKMERCEITLTELAFECNLPPSLQGYGHMKQFVLDPAFKEINASTDIMVSYVPVKTRRAYTSLKLKIKSKPRENATTSQPPKVDVAITTKCSDEPHRAAPMPITPKKVDPVLPLPADWEFTDDERKQYFVAMDAARTKGELDDILKAYREEVSPEAWQYGERLITSAHTQRLESLLASYAKVKRH